MRNSDRQTANKAVRYLRMSTEHQRYSLDNQAAAIASSAAEKGLEIVGSYEDPGKSGLSLKGRPGLQRLLADCISPGRAFSVILVLDVSRWGRFQDTDEAAHYEFICRQAGVRVIYCAEPFGDQGGAFTGLLKHLKRVMAAEYSRELSAKVARAQKQQARLGYWQGGPPSYGFQRVLLDTDGSPRCVLRPCETKAMRGERVVLRPGPPAEVAIVRRIFRLYANTTLTAREVAQRLNRSGLKFRDGTPWTPMRVLAVLKNEFCIGRYVWNRSDQMLGKGRGKRPPAEWIRTRVDTKIVSSRLFNLAAEKRRHHGGAQAGAGLRVPDVQLLDSLAALLQRRGRLTRSLIRLQPHMLGDDTYRERFGSLAKAYALVGYVRPGLPSDAQVIEGVERLHREHGYVSATLIEADPALPGINTIYRRFGSLTRLYERAGLAGNAAQAQSLGTRRGRRERLHQGLSH